MHAVLSKKLRSDRRVWIWTSALVFIVLGFVDPDGKGTGKMDLPPLFFAIGEILRSSHWFGDSTGVGALYVFHELFFIGIFVAAVAFISGLVGWLLQFLLTPLLPLRADQDLGAVVVIKPPSDSGSSRNAVVLMVLAAYGVGATVFGAGISGLSGIQFWCVWFAYDQAHRAATGFHTWSSSHSLFLLLIVCLLNAVGSALLARRITSPKASVRLVGIVILGIQFSTLALPAGTLGLEMSL